MLCVQMLLMHTACQWRPTLHWHAVCSVWVTTTHHPVYDQLQAAEAANVGLPVKLVMHTVYLGWYEWQCSPVNERWRRHIVLPCCCGKYCL